MKKTPQKVGYLSRNSVVSEIFLLLPNSLNGRIHVTKCGLQSNCIQNWELQPHIVIKVCHPKNYYKYHFKIYILYHKHGLLICILIFYLGKSRFVSTLEKFRVLHTLICLGSLVKSKSKFLLIFWRLYLNYKNITTIQRKNRFLALQFHESVQNPTKLCQQGCYQKIRLLEMGQGFLMSPKFYCLTKTLLVCNRGDAYYSITVSSRQGSQAKAKKIKLLPPGYELGAKAMKIDPIKSKSSGQNQQSLATKIFCGICIWFLEIFIKVLVVNDYSYHIGKNLNTIHCIHLK